MKKLSLILVLALSLVGGSQASADSSWFELGVTWEWEQEASSPDVGVTWE
jgi:hypothetical protein